MKKLLLITAVFASIACVAQNKTTLIPKVSATPDTTSLDYKMKKFIKNQETEIKQARKEKGKKQPIKQPDKQTANRETAAEYLRKNK